MLFKGRLQNGTLFFYFYQVNRRTKISLALLVVFVAIMWYYFVLPQTLFSDPYSTVLEDHAGNLLSATIARDGQWRFPERESIPSKFAEAIVAFEDKRFYIHNGVDVPALA